MKITLLSAIILSSLICFSCEKTNENSVVTPVIKTKREIVEKGQDKGFTFSGEKKDNEWIFSLEPNYNCIVKEEDILKATGIENVKKLLETLPENETIQLVPNSEGKYPPSEILYEIYQHCKKINVYIEFF